MPQTGSTEEVLSFYRDLARRLAAGDLSPEKATATVSNLPGNTQPAAATAAIRQLRAEAEDKIYCAPREGRALAHIAVAAATSLTDDVLRAECMLTLATACHCLGEFLEVIPLCEDAARMFTDHGRAGEVARCYRVAAQARNELKQPERASVYLERMRALLGPQATPIEVARGDVAEAGTRYCQGHYAEASALLETARETFTAAGLSLEVARCDLGLARVLFLSDPGKALTHLDSARAIFDEHRHAPEVTLCDYYKALALQEINRYSDALMLLQQVRKVFAWHGMDFYVALTDAMIGINLWRMNRFDEALAAGQRARHYFAGKEIAAWAAMSEVNLALVYYSLNRYQDALTLYASAAELCLRENLLVEAARCHENMALAYEKLGRYDQALALHQRARRAFREQGLDTYVAICDENMAATYRWLSRHDEALQHYTRARETFVQRDLPIYVARCDTHMADTYLMMGRFEEALSHLEEARATFEQQGMALHVAACDRGIAQVQAKLGRSEESLALLEQARESFADARMIVDAALCDLAAGEVYLSMEQWEPAETLFAGALQTLDFGLPDQGWRAQYGLGKCALGLGELTTALNHYLSAVEKIRWARARLPTEQMSGSFFTGRRQVYEDALRLALEVEATEQALGVVEASKAQSFLTFRQAQGRLLRLAPSTGSGRRSGQALAGHPGVSWRRPALGDSYLAELLDREAALRREIEALRQELILQEVDPTQPIVRGEELHVDNPSEILARLAALSQDYEEVIERLRLIAPRLAEVQRPPTFSVETLREMATSCLPAHWACLEYYLLDDTLITFYLDPVRLRSYARQLNAYDRLALRQCTSLEADFRELIYRGTIRGHRTPGTPGRTYRQHLYDLLIPPEVGELTEEDLLIVAPHGPLHWLPFQALLTDDVPLVARVPLIYVPSLGALQLLATSRSETASVGRILACGLSDYGVRARPLPHTAEEVAAIQQVVGERLDILWGSDASRKTLQDLNQAGNPSMGSGRRLVDYDVIHFACHAVLDSQSPSQSRLLLVDDDLTVVDILDLTLAAQLVVLSACEGAGGRMSPGDEIMGLARAFFLAGARTVVASLWPVEDVAAREVMVRFYRRLCAGEGVAHALRAAQLDMAREGYDPYQWASFIAIGMP